VPVAARTALTDAAAAEGGWLDLLADPAAVEETARLTRSADETLNRNPDYRAELRAWTRTDDGPDGVPVRMGGPAPDPYEMLVRRNFGGAGASRHGYEQQPLIGLLGAAGDRPGDQVRAGLALQRVLLTATGLGLATALFTQPVDVAEVRARLGRVPRRPEPPQVLIRIGYAVKIAPTGRRDPDEVIVPDPTRVAIYVIGGI
jgi:hypothetical protein